jgi:hypothetical protein
MSTPPYGHSSKSPWPSSHHAYQPSDRYSPSSCPGSLPLHSVAATVRPNMAILEHEAVKTYGACLERELKTSVMAQWMTQPPCEKMKCPSHQSAINTIELTLVLALVLKLNKDRIIVMKQSRRVLLSQAHQAMEGSKPRLLSRRRLW